ncbi:hypothetical protein, partial [Caldilinea sp.]|uniref:hypothetical protein n=1 Tax=Caldilinea sp. TaxID=2293560 RepID=UPI002C3E4096|nr:hypothetical protein [Caldilinea sp.]
YGPNWNWTLTSRNSWFQSGFTLAVLFLVAIWRAQSYAPVHPKGGVVGSIHGWKGRTTLVHASIGEILFSRIVYYFSSSLQPTFPRT